MEKLLLLNTSFLHPYLNAFVNEVNALSSQLSKSSSTIEDKFYASISNHEDNLTAIATNMTKQNSDYILDKSYVNPYFIQQNTTSTLLDTVLNEEVIHDQDEVVDDAFSDVSRKMKNFLSMQKTQREQEKEKKLRAAVEEYRWLYLPKLISPYLKNFLQDCFLTEHLVENFVKTVLENGTEIVSTSHSSSDCIFGFTLKDCLNNKDKQQFFNQLFLPGVYALPESLNSVYVFNKYMEQFYPSNVEIDDGKDTMFSRFFNTIKFQNVNKTQTVSNFIKQYEGELRQPIWVDGEIESDVQRLRKIQNLTIIFLIMKKRYPELELVRAERGCISVVTNEFIIKANNLYFYERLNLWCLFLPNNNKLVYTYNILDLFMYMIQT